MPRRKSLKLSTPQEIRMALSRVSNMVLNGELDSKQANSIILACNTILSSIRMDEQQEGSIETWKTAIIEIAARRKEKQCI